MIHTLKALQSRVSLQSAFRIPIAVIAATSGLLFSTPVLATVVFGPGGDIDWASPVVSKNGNAVGSPAVVDTTGTTNDGRVLRLASDSLQGQAGSAFWHNPYVLGPNSDFRAEFTFRIHPADSSGGVQSDGLTFVIARSTSALGVAGGDLGYGGISPSVAIEFDVHANGWDSNDSHVAVLKNGDVQNHLAQRPTALRLDNGHKWRAIVNYLGQTDFLTVDLVDLERPDIGSVGLSTIINIAEIMGCGSAGCVNSFFGFTAATGLGTANHDIINWSLTVPEPGTVPLVALSLSVLGFLSVRGNRKPLR